MLDNVSIYKTEGNGGTSSGNGGGNKPENPDEGGSGEAPDPAAYRMNHIYICSSYTQVYVQTAYKN